MWGFVTMDGITYGLEKVTEVKLLLVPILGKKKKKDSYLYR